MHGLYQRLAQSVYLKVSLGIDIKINRGNGLKRSHCLYLGDLLLHCPAVQVGHMEFCIGTDRLFSSRKDLARNRWQALAFSGRDGR